MRRNAIALLTFLCIAAAGTAGAEGNIHLGKLQIDPYASVQESWTDNVYFTPTDEQSDRYMRFLPGVKVAFPFGEHQFEAEYFALFTRYNTFSGEDTTDQTGRGRLGLNFGRSLTLDLSDAYTKNHEGRGESATGFIEVYRLNTAKATAAYRLADRSKVQVDYSHSTYNYMISDFRDRDENLVAAYVYYRFLPKTSAFIEYDHKTVDFTLAANDPSGNSLDNTQDSVLVGITWEATAKSTGTMKVGRTKKNFESSAVTDLTMWSWYVDIDHQFSDDTRIKLAGKRQPNETDFFGTSYYITTGASVDFTQRILSKTDLLLVGSYGTDKFSDGRKDTTTILGAGLKYWIKDWFNVNADYRQQKRDSNLATAEYTEHRTTIGASVVF